MVFGEVKRYARWKGASDELRRVFLPVPVDVNVEALFRDVMSSLSLNVMVVSNDLNPRVSQAIF